MPVSSETAVKPSLYRALVLKLLDPLQLGHLRLTLPSGETLTFGSPDSPHRASIDVKREEFFKKCALYGDVGFGEAYVDGDWDSDDVTGVIAWMILNVENHPTLMDKKPKSRPVNFFAALNNLRHKMNANTPGGSRRNIKAHYDLGNSFFKLFLDPTMAYSCARFDSADEPLETAQRRKFEECCELLRLEKSDRVLEIGGGWGGFAIHAAKTRGCRVTAITLSDEQLVYASKRARDEGVSDRVEVKLVDYRKMTGVFDKIVSIEMIEAVGHEFLGAYFGACHRLLKKDGLLAIQAILSPDNRYDSFRKNSDWIQKHIFPGGLLPSFDAIQKAVRSTGELGLLSYDDMTPQYALTLERWRLNLAAKKSDALGQGFDETHLRKWNYYFAYCEGAFRMRNIAVARMVFTRPNNFSLK